MSYSIGAVQLSKWQLALLIGAPVAVGLGYYAFKHYSADDPNPATKNKKNRQKSLLSDNTSVVKKKNAELSSEKLTPLKEATNYKNEGNICYKNGKYDEAITFYDKAIDKCPAENKTDLAIFHQNRAAAYEMLKKWTCVKEDCTRSLEYNPRYAKAYFRRAKAYEATNDWFDCLDDLTATCILEMFQNNNTIMFADRVLKLTGRADSEERMKDRVMNLPSTSLIRTYLRSFVADPIQKLTLPPTVETENPRGFVRAKLAMDSERFDEIIAACTEEIESSEAESQYKSEALLLRGTFHLVSGNFDESKQDLDAVIDNADADIDLRVSALIKRASLYIQLEQKDKGLADYTHAQHLRPDNADVYHQRAQNFILLDELPEALEEFEKAVKIAPEHAMAFAQKCYTEYRMALLSQDQMRLMIVMNEFKNAIEKFPDCVDLYHLMAQLLSDQQQFEQADVFYGKAIKIAPDNAVLHVHRGIMHLQWHGDAPKAIELMEKAIEVDKKCELAYETLGTIEVQRANLDRAVEMFEKAIALAKTQNEMIHLFALRNAAKAQINVTKKLRIDMSTISEMAQSGILSAGMAAGAN